MERSCFDILCGLFAKINRLAALNGLENERVERDRKRQLTGGWFECSSLVQMSVCLNYPSDHKCLGKSSFIFQSFLLKQSSADG